MKKRHEGQEFMQMCKMIAAVGLVVGFSLFLLGVIASGCNKDFFLAIVSLEIIGVSMFMFGFGTFVGILTGAYRDTRENM
ncbi:MFS transporter [Parageobacillus toebii]|uniref:Uncharacterized protein n=1 Tax=Parageobacillus toebii TaxID=153151 RepID=A0A150MJG0_9BACL|nr:MFS transporter [Parageobacillus toebii]KYD24667.1 hypothetical protein B4110_0676 [Parageobacillus toebii]